MTYRFDPKEHAYYADDRRLPSVTEILSKTGLYKDLSFLNLGPQHLQKGSAVHHACRLVDQDRLDESGTHPDILPYAQAYAEFKRMTGFVGRAWEVPMIDARSGYAGTLDVLGSVGDDTWLVDFKTGVLDPGVAEQLVAYEQLLRNGVVLWDSISDTDTDWLQNFVDEQPVISRRQSLSLQKNGRFTLKDHTTPSSVVLWRSALNIYTERVRRKTL